MQPITPMSLRNRRQNGVRSVIDSCSKFNCRHEVIVNVDHLPADLAVPCLGPHMRCERCGQRGADIK